MAASETCERHGTTYTALEPCAQCWDDPGPAPSAEVEATDDDAVLAIERIAHETGRALIERGMEWIRIREENGHKDRIGESTVVKLFDAGAKYLRLELEIVDRRVQRAHEKYVADSARALAGIKGAH